MSKLCEVRSEVRCSPEGFFSAVEVWVKKPHVVNKRLCGVKEDEGQTVCSDDLGHTLALLTRTAVQDLAEVLLFLHIHPADSGSKSGEPWHVGVRTIIPKVETNPNEPNRFKEIIVKSKIKMRPRASESALGLLPCSNMQISNKKGLSYLHLFYTDLYFIQI